MAKVKTSANGRRYVEIDGVIERRLEQIKNGKGNSNGNGNGNYRKSSTVSENNTVPKPADPSDRGRSIPAT